VPSRLDPRKAPKQPRAQETVDALLEAAAQVFERHGYAAGTTNRIAQRAGVSIGSLYQYYPNKDAILVALVRRHVAEGTLLLQAQVERLAAGDPPLAVLEDVVAAMVALHAAAPGLHRTLFEETPLPAALRAQLVATEDAFAATVGAALARAGLRDTPLAGAVVVALVEGLTHRLVLRPPPGASEEAIAAEIHAAVRAFAATDGAEPA
jgi:AcrR family transcriptional regulator